MELCHVFHDIADPVFPFLVEGDYIRHTSYLIKYYVFWQLSLLHTGYESCADDPSLAHRGLDAFATRFLSENVSRFLSFQEAFVCPF